MLSSRVEVQSVARSVCRHCIYYVELSAFVFAEPRFLLRCKYLTYCFAVRLDSLLDVLMCVFTNKESSKSKRVAVCEYSSSCAFSVLGNFLLQSIFSVSKRP